MKYILKTMDGNKFSITDKEYQATIMGDGLLVFSSCGITINKSRIESIYPENSSDMIEDRKNQQEGILHDGTRVRRHFGQWVDAYSQVPDDNGKYVPVKLDEQYYPEVARDCVPTPEEYQKIAHLTSEEKKKLILQGTTERLNTSQGLEKLSFKQYDTTN